MFRFEVCEVGSIRGAVLAQLTYATGGYLGVVEYFDGPELDQIIQAIAGALTPELEHLLNITPEQASHVLAHFGEGGYHSGSFISALISAITCADPVNTSRLRLGFPEYVEAVQLARDTDNGITRLRHIASAPAGPQVMHDPSDTSSCRLTARQLDTLMCSLLAAGWRSPYSARVADFTNEEIAAGKLRAADAECGQWNLATLRNAVEDALCGVSPADAEERAEAERARIHEEATR